MCEVFLPGVTEDGNVRFKVDRGRNASCMIKSHATPQRRPVSGNTSERRLKEDLCDYGVFPPCILHSLSL